MSEFLTAISDVMRNWPWPAQAGVIVIILYYGRNMINAGEKISLKNVAPPPHSQPQWMTDIHDIRRDVEEIKDIVTQIKLDLYARSGTGNFEHIPLRPPADTGGGR